MQTTSSVTSFVPRKGDKGKLIITRGREWIDLCVLQVERLGDDVIELGSHPLVYFPVSTHSGVEFTHITSIASGATLHIGWKYVGGKTFPLLNTRTPVWLKLLRLCRLRDARYYKVRGCDLEKITVVVRNSVNVDPSLKVLAHTHDWQLILVV